VFSNTKNETKIHINQNMFRYSRNEEECITKKPNITLIFCKKKKSDGTHSSRARKFKNRHCLRIKSLKIKMALVLLLIGMILLE